MDLKSYLSDLEYLVNIDSGSETLEGLHKVASFFSERFSQMGWNVKEYDFAPDAGTCVICTNREAEHYDLMLIGHIDTVFPEGTCKERPFFVDGNKAYGPGVADMKNGSLLMYYILKNLPEEVNQKLNIVAVFNPDEETGSKWSETAYAEYAKKTDYAYLYESAASNGERCVQRKGAIGLNINFKGVSGHCGNMFSNGSRSAVSEMARWIVRLDSLRSEELDTTVNTGVASGGTKTNVVAEAATMKVSIRFINPDERDRVEKTIQTLLEEAKQNQITVDISKVSIPSWTLTDKSRAYVKHIEELTRLHNMEFKYPFARGGLSDANVIAKYGPICIDGMGPIGSKTHSPNEFMLIDSIIPAFDLSNLLIKDLADNKKFI